MCLFVEVIELVSNDISLATIHICWLHRYSSKMLNFEQFYAQKLWHTCSIISVPAGVAKFI